LKIFSVGTFYNDVIGIILEQTFLLRNTVESTDNLIIFNSTVMLLKNQNQAKYNADLIKPDKGKIVLPLSQSTYILKYLKIHSDICLAIFIQCNTKDRQK